MNENLFIGAITLPIKYGDLSGIKYKTTYTTELNLIQPIFNGGKLYFSYKINQLIHQQNILLLNNQKSEIIYKTVSLYYNLLKLQALEEIAEKNLKSTKEHLSIINEKYKQGLVQKSDVLQWKVKLENDKTNLEEIKNNKKIIHMFWLQCIWLDYPNKNIYPEKINIIDYKSKVLEYNNITDDDKEKKIEKLYSTFLKNNYTIKSLYIMRKIAKNNYNLSYSNFLPSINLQYKKQFEKDNKFDFEGEKNWFIGVNINLSLFESGKNYTNFKKSYYEYQENKFKIKDIEENYQISFRNCFYNLISHSKKISNNELALENAKENNKIINNLYEQGMATNSELIDSEIMLFSSEINLLSSYIVAGYDINKDPEKVKENIGYMSQKFSLYEDLTVEENINFYGGIYGLNKKEIKTQFSWIIEMADLKGMEKRKTKTLAGGWKQRLALGSALLHKPKIIFLDEPTGDVDSISRRNFWDIIYLLSQSGVTVFVTTHYLDEAEFCNNIYLIQTGKIVANGTPIIS